MKTKMRKPTLNDAANFLYSTHDRCGVEHFLSGWIGSESDDFDSYELRKSDGPIEINNYKKISKSEHSKRTKEELTLRKKYILLAQVLHDMAEAIETGISFEVESYDEYITRMKYYDGKRK